MTTDLQLSKEEAAEFAEFLKTKVSAIDDKIAPLLKEKEALLDRIAKLSGPEKVKSAAVARAIEVLGRHLVNKIPETNIGKIKYVLKEGGNRPLPTRKILDRLFVLMPELLIEKDKVSKNVSTVLSINQGPDKTFNRTTDTDGNYLFNINPEYMD